MSSRTSKKGSKILLFFLLIILVLIAVFFIKKAKDEADSDTKFNMSSNAERVRFLNEQGLIVKPDPVSTEEIIIPSEANDTYADYARLLKEQGFNIEKYLGRNVVRITYEVLNFPDYDDNVMANMLIADDRLIGGDISLNEEGGFVLPLVSKKTAGKLMEDDPAEETTAVTTAAAR